jgi:hypothetical protein
MEVQKRAVAMKTWRDYIDISKYTEMEVEHKHDTINSYKHL